MEQQGFSILAVVAALLSAAATCALLVSKGYRGWKMIAWSVLALALPITLPFISLGLLFGWRGQDEPRRVSPGVALLLVIANALVLWQAWLDALRLDLVPMFLQPSAIGSHGARRYYRSGSPAWALRRDHRPRPGRAARGDGDADVGWAASKTGVGASTATPGRAGQDIRSVKVYQLVERRHGKVYELVDIAPHLDGLARAFARAALGRALDDLHQARSALTRAATRLQAQRARAWITTERARVVDLQARLVTANRGR